MNIDIPEPSLVVSLNSNKVIEYIRQRQLTKQQLDDLDKLESKLDAGITIAGKFVQSPNAKDKAIFIANNLVTALDAGNDSIVAVSCSYLASRHPDLKQIQISTNDDQISIQLIYDKEFIEQTPIKFISKKDIS